MPSDAINWTEEFDDDDNSVWVGASPYVDDDRSINWRLRQKLMGNRIEWHADHDAELEAPDWWLTLDDAKSAVQEMHDTILRDLANAE